MQVFSVELMEESTREELDERIQGIARKYRDMRVLEAKVHFHEHDETFRDVSLLLARVRLYNGQRDVRGFGRGLRRSSRRLARAERDRTTDPRGEDSRAEQEAGGCRRDREDVRLVAE